jgi:hypothetical protein
MLIDATVETMTIDEVRQGKPEPPTADGGRRATVAQDNVGSAAKVAACGGCPLVARDGYPPMDDDPVTDKNTAPERASCAGSLRPRMILSRAPICW